MERPSPSNPEQPSPEQQLVERELRQAELEGRPISPTAARLIASRWHDGQASHLYAFQSTGAISYGIADEISPTYHHPDTSTEDLRELEHLVRFIAAQEVDSDGERGPQANWHELTKDWGEPSPLQPALLTESGYDEDNECIYCGEHLANPHAPGCPRADADLEEHD